MVFQSDETVEMLMFNLKMLGRKTKKNILVSTGKREDKQRMLPAIQRLAGLSTHLYATEGTSRFLNENGVKNTKIYKIAEKKSPNIKSFLSQDRFDLVINILVGQHDYDESTDSNLIRQLAIQNGIPLITDVEVALMTIDEMARTQVEGPTQMKTAEAEEAWDMKSAFFRLVKARGGFANHHAHFDKAYLISPENLKLGQVDMQKKWDLYRYLKENYTHKDLVTRISRGVEKMIQQGVTYCKTMVDGDSTAKLLPIKAALEVKEKYRDQIRFEVGIQPLQGVLEPKTRKYFVESCELADFIGGLPSKDRPTPEKHLDFLMELAKDLNKTIDVHVDQENNPDEHETELLAVKTLEHGLQGRVQGVHCISLSAQPEAEQDRVIELMKEADLGVIICPSAAMSMRQLNKNAPLHNSIAPFVKLNEAGVRTYLGVDNIYDLFMPMVDGDVWVECRFMMEACRYYDIDSVADWACRR